jgi:hypothetical protein
MLFFGVQTLFHINIVHTRDCKSLVYFGLAHRGLSEFPYPLIVLLCLTFGIASYVVLGSEIVQYKTVVMLHNVLLCNHMFVTMWTILRFMLTSFTELARVRIVTCEYLGQCLSECSCACAGA